MIACIGGIGAATRPGCWLAGWNGPTINPSAGGHAGANAHVAPNRFIYLPGVAFPVDG
ncbi:hypothetical protein [Spirosoma jeollabukense]